MTLQPERGMFPPILQRALRFVPPPPLGFVLTRAVRRLAHQRPDLFDRLDAYRHAHFIINPIDLPHVFRLIPNGEHASVEMLPRKDMPEGTARISGPLIVLLGLVDGTYDGDAVFFTRDLVIDGDTDAVLALRNTMEEADLTPAELLGFKGEVRKHLDATADKTFAKMRAYLNAPQAST
ncbi:MULTISPECIES: ubiquinone anaerobic biosynthesis accessory factor UbiT [Pseudovibrio]|uniref:ubiquinone anaerobic biosynthesis accessory factor UbiT n=1 Tax=Stappiaceae TaxID=2821832 RepID=UPI002365B434|nr:MULTISPECIES: SCP2 sterol-binding domain-containing protein [Pseudovibrio]MDD7909878.1 SCP2 sterol-binding domain-containing protein [Pseudovibrio exalbescens]MDX5592216.1 SCP2 sterol-binding domain-containing protein [Pseudovibrio sp. SPO723]